MTAKDERPKPDRSVDRLRRTGRSLTSTRELASDDDDERDGPRRTMLKEKMQRGRLEDGPSLSTSSSFAYPTGPPTLQGPTPPSQPPFYSLGSTNLALIVVPAFLGLVLLLALGWYVFRRQKIRIGRRRSFGTSTSTTTTTTIEEDEIREEGDVPSSPLEKFRSIFRSSQPTQDGGRPADGNDDDDGGSSVRWDPIPPLPGPSPAYTPTTRSLAGGGGMRSEEELEICWAREVRRATEIAHPPPSAPPSSSSPPLSSAGASEGTVGSLVEEEEGDDDDDGRSTLRSFEIVCSPAYYLEYDPSCRPGSEIIFVEVPSAEEGAGRGGGEGGGGESTEGGGTSSSGHLLRGEKEAERSG